MVQVLEELVKHHQSPDGRSAKAVVWVKILDSVVVSVV